ncbi:MAG: restriction endonuclease subunit S [Candidatus Cloacimonetes bacterium]|nr:restriction endonuclease subunit S [Candidatus Cloacimonadota bacterium]
MRPYEKYKQSGIDWIEQIPEDWEVRRVKDTVNKIGNGVTPLGGSSVYSDFGVPFLRSQNVYDNGLRINNVSFISDTIHNSMRNSSLKKYDILINITGASIGRTCLVPESLEKANINQHIAFLRINTNNHFFISVFLKSQLIKDYIFSEQLGASKEAFNLSQIANIPLILPNDILQTKIANYLDQKTTQIDKKINLLGQKLSKYEELKKTLINETVCRGLDKNVELKESGVEWIGKIPKHWEVKRVKESLRKKITDGPHESPEFQDSGFPFLSVDGIVDGELVFKNCRYIDKDDYKRFSKKVKIERNDIFIGKAASIGKVARVKVDFKFTVWSPIAVLKFNNKYSISYIEYFLKSNVVHNQFETLCTTNTQKNIAMKDIPKINILFPILFEQIQIANYLDEKCDKIDKIRATIQKETALLKDFRKTLINDVVTGKVKIN